MNARTDLPALDAIRAIDDEMRATRHAIHANPELGFEEQATSDLVAERLQRVGRRFLTRQSAQRPAAQPAPAHLSTCAGFAG